MVPLPLLIIHHFLCGCHSATSSSRLLWLQKSPPPSLCPLKWSPESNPTIQECDDDSSFSRTYSNTSGATLTWRAQARASARRAPPSRTFFFFFFLVYARTAAQLFPPPTHPTTNKRCVLRIQRAKNKVVLLLLSEWAVEKQQLQYNLMGNKFPFLLSTWPPATNPRAWRVVNFHGKVVNFHKQQPFLCFRRLSHRHLYFLQKGARDVLNMTQHEKAGKVLDVEMWEYSVGLSWMWLHLVFPLFFSPSDNKVCAVSYCSLSCFLLI